MHTYKFFLLFFLVFTCVKISAQQYHISRFPQTANHIKYYYNEQTSESNYSAYATWDYGYRKTLIAETDPHLYYYEIYHSVYKFDLTGLPQDAYNIKAYLQAYRTSGSYDSKIVSVPDNLDFGDYEDCYYQSHIGSEYFTVNTSPGTDHDITSLVLSKLSQGYINFGLRGANYSSNNTGAITIILKLNYDAPSGITADNNFTASGGSNNGSIKVDGISQTAPYPFSRNIGTNVTLQAVTPQNDNQSHQMIWHTGSTNKSEWTRNTDHKSYNQTYGFTVAADDDGKTYLANFRKNYAISRSEQTEFDGTSSAGVITHIVEQNSGNITAPSTKSVNGKSYYFSYWTDNGSASNPRSVTPTDNTTYTAYYKAHLYSNLSTATTTNSQRKIVQNSSGDWAMVYTSSNKIWLSHSTDGTNWDGEKLISDDGYTDGYPSIAISGDLAYIVWQAIGWAGGTGFDFGAIYMRSYNLSSGSLGTTVQIATFTPNIEAFQANPVIDGAWQSGIYDFKMIAWREPNGIKVKQYDDYSGWSSIGTVSGTNSNSYNPSICYYSSHPYLLCWEDSYNDDIKYAEASYSQSWSFTYSATVSPTNWESNARPQIALVGGNKPTVVWSSRNNVAEGIPSVHVRQRSGSTWGTITSFSYSTYSSETLSPVIGNYSGNSKMDVLWNVGNTVFKGSYNGSSWSGPTTVTTSGGTGVNINKSTSYQTKAVWKKSDNTIAFYNIGGTPPPKSSVASIEKEIPLAYRLNRHAIIELPMLSQADLSTEASAQVEGSVCFEIAGISTLLKDSDLSDEAFPEGMDTQAQSEMKIDYSQDTLNLLSSVPFKVTVPGMELNFRGAIYGKGLEISQNFISSLNEPLAKVVLKDSKTGEVLKDIWTNNPSMLNSVKDKTFGEFRETNVNLNNFLGKTVYVEVQMLGKAKKVQPIIVNDYLILSDSTASSDELNKQIAVYDLPSDYTLMQNYPNPFNPSTTISFYLPQSNHVSLKIYNTLGKEIMTAANENMEEGYHAINLNMENEPSGIYFYTLTAGNFTNTKKLLLLK